MSLLDSWGAVEAYLNSQDGTSRQEGESREAETEALLLSELPRHTAPVVGRSPPPSYSRISDVSSISSVSSISRRPTNDNQREVHLEDIAALEHVLLDEAEESDDEEVKTPSKMKRFFSPVTRLWDRIPPRAKWCKMLILWIIVECLFLTPHVVGSFMIKEGTFGIAQLRSIPCKKRTVWEVFVIGLPINIIASLVIAASNNARQILLAPSRADIDRAHKAGMVWEIGFSSMVNFRNISRTRKLVWLLLGMASLPLHLLYNSLFVVMPSAHDAYQVIISSEPFHNGTPVQLDPLKPDNIKSSNNITYKKVPSYNKYIDSFPELAELETAISDIQNGHLDPQQWKNLSQADCANTYKSKIYGTQSHVVLFTKWSDANLTATTNNSAIFLGTLMGANYGFQSLIDYCPPTWLSSPKGENFTRPSSYKFSTKLGQLCDSYKNGKGNLTDYNTYPDSGNTIEYCLSKVEEEKCVIAMPVLFLRIIAVVLALQAIGMVATLLIEWKRTPLLVVGDAITSFLKHPDTVQFEDRKIKVQDSAGEYNGIIVIILSVPVYLWFMAALIMGTTKSMRPGLTVPDRSDRLWFFKLVLWSNSIQMLTVIRQFFENAFITASAAQQELSSLAHKRQGLRVTQPSGGAQRGSYLLSMPMSRAIGHIIASAVLHWWLSIFLSLSLVLIYRVGDPEPWVQAANRSASALGNSIPNTLIWWQSAGKAAEGPGAEMFVVAFLIPFLLLGIPLIIHGFMLGYLSAMKRGKGGDGDAGARLRSPSSWTLSWACHPPEAEGDISERKVRYRRIGSRPQAPIVQEEVNNDEEEQEGGEGRHGEESGVSRRSSTEDQEREDGNDEATEDAESLRRRKRIRRILGDEDEDDDGVYSFTARKLPAEVEVKKEKFLVRVKGWFAGWEMRRKEQGREDSKGKIKVTR